MTNPLASWIWLASPAAAYDLAPGAAWDDDDDCAYEAEDHGVGIALVTDPDTCTQTDCLWPSGNGAFTTTTNTVTYNAADFPNRALNVQVRFPTLAPGETAPVVIATHGGSAGIALAQNAIPGWSNQLAEAGYVVVTIAHATRNQSQTLALCARLGYAASGTECGGVLAYDRPYDIRAVLDWVHSRVSAPPPGQESQWAKLDLENIGILGYSGGGSAALQMGGLRRTLGITDVTTDEPRIDAIVSVAPNTDGQGLTNDSFLTVNRPVLMVTGVNDISDTTTTPEGRLEAFLRLPDRDHQNYLVYLDQPVPAHGFYSFELAACRNETAAILNPANSADPAAQAQALAICQEYATWLLSSVVAFLDSELRDDPLAADWLLSGEIELASDGTCTVDQDIDDDLIYDFSGDDLCYGSDPSGDFDSDGLCADRDEDDDNDGVLDGSDVCLGDDASGDLDLDLSCDDVDPDDDGDSVLDERDVCRGFDDALDADLDAVPDGCDLCVGDDGLGDADLDGFCADEDACEADADKIDAGVCGCGTSDSDQDNDEVVDCLEESLVLDGDGAHVFFGNSPFAAFSGQLELGGGLLASDLRDAEDLGSGHIGVTVSGLDVYDESVAFDVRDTSVCGDEGDNREVWESDQGDRERSTLRWRNSMSYDSSRDPLLPELGDDDNVGRVRSRFIRADSSRLRVEWNKDTVMPLTVTIDGVVLATVDCASVTCTTGYTVDTAYVTAEVYNDGSRRRTVDVEFPLNLGDGNVMAWYNATADELGTAAPLFQHEAIDDGSAEATYYNAGGRFYVQVPLEGSGLTVDDEPTATLGLWFGAGDVAISGCYTFGDYAVDVTGKHWRFAEIDEDGENISAPVGVAGFQPFTVYPDLDGNGAPDDLSAGRSWCSVPAGWAAE